MSRLEAGGPEEHEKTLRNDIVQGILPA